VDAPDKLNGVSAPAGRETAPKVSLQVYPEGSGIVASAEGTVYVLSVLDSRQNVEDALLKRLLGISNVRLGFCR
jgi:hypothetical protein